VKPSLVCFSLAAALVARSDGRFTVLRSSAEPLGGLSAFLEKYIGACGPGSAPQCESAASSFRSHANAKRFFFAAGDEAASLLSAGRFDEATGECDLKLTPFFAAGPYALTQGTPRETDAAGNPLIPLIVLRGKAPEGFSASRLQRLISARELRIELVFTPQAVWTLPSKRGGRIRGVRSRIDGLQVLSVRTGEVLASWP
jgi:hypothetical protein